MKNELVKSVSHYSKTILGIDIEIVKEFQFEDCRVSSITITTDDTSIKFLINIEYNSLKKLANKIFDFEEEEFILDLQKDLVNTIGGRFADKYFQKGYKLSLPSIEKICDTQHGIYFQNEILKLNVRLKVV
jgi:hypothetical protein